MPDQPPICAPADVPESFRARTAGLDTSGPKPGTELRIGQFSILYLLIFYKWCYFFYYIYININTFRNKDEGFVRLDTKKDTNNS